MHVNALFPRFAAAVDPSQDGYVSPIVRDERDAEEVTFTPDGRAKADHRLRWEEIRDCLRRAEVAVPPDA